MRRISMSPAGIRVALGVAISLYVAAVFSITGYAGQSRPVTQGVYSADQAKRGEDLYKAQCLVCHGEMLEGVVGPQLTGDPFLVDFGAPHPLADLVSKIQSSMPQQAPGTLTQQQALDLTAYILQAGKYPAGRADLTAAASPQITLPAPQNAPAPAATASAAGIQFTAVANLAQYMRGVTFPNANIIFNTQLKDPGKEKPKPPVPFDYVLWGQTAYPGWQAVDQAILALKETTPLFLLPGRRCQNGRPVPVNKADYQQYTRDLVNFTDELWKAAQSRNVDTLSAMSEKLNDVCANCHKVYRDVVPAGQPQSSSLEGGIIADRCRQ